MIKINYFAFSAIVCLALASCIYDPETSRLEEKEGEATIELVLETPAPIASFSTRVADTAFENGVNDVAVFVCSETGGVITIEDIVHDIKPQAINSTTSSFSLSLEPGSAPITLLVYANISTTWGSIWSSESALDGIKAQTYNDESIHGLIVDLLAYSTASGSGTGMIMGAEVSLGVINPLQQIELNVPLLRAVARADISLNLEQGSGTFIPAEIYMYHVPQYIQVIPNSDAYTGEDYTKVTYPSPVTGDIADFTGTVDNVNGTTGMFSTVYLSENAAATTPQERLDASCIIVGGYYNGSSEISYYRMDFNSGITGHPFGQILRNWQYRFNITHVSASGYTTPGEAAQNLPASMALKVVPWSNNTNDIFFPDSGNYFQLSQRGITLPYEAGTSTSVEIVSTLPFSLSLLQPDGGAIDSDDVTSSGITIGNSLYEIDLKAISSSANPNGLTETVYELTVTALTDNTSGMNFSDIHAVVGSTTVDIPINQNAIPTYVPPRVLHIHSLTNSFGSLGTYPDTSTAHNYADALRTMLLNPSDFGPGGTVKLDQIVMTESTLTWDFDADSDAPALEATLSNVNVLLVPGYTLTSDAVPSPACVRVILDWMKDPTHVLILIREDGENANIALRNALPYSMQWDSGETDLDNLLGLGILVNYNYGTPTGSDLLPGDGRDEIFMNGPFGKVDRDAYFSDTDGIFGYVQDPFIAPNVIPLINVNGVLASIPYEVPAMVMGVDPTNRIVWMGEGQLGSSLYMGVSTDLTILMGNLWAWITDTANP